MARRRASTATRRTSTARASASAAVADPARGRTCARAGAVYARGRTHVIRAVLILDVMLFRKALAAALTTADVTVVCELSCADVNGIDHLPEPPDIVVVDFDARHAA